MNFDTVRGGPTQYRVHAPAGRTVRGSASRDHGFVPNPGQYENPTMVANTGRLQLQDRPSLSAGRVRMAAPGVSLFRPSICFQFATLESTPTSVKNSWADGTY